MDRLTKQLNGEVLEEVKSFKYLGLLASRNESLEDEVR